MNDERARNRNQWAQLTRRGYVESTQQQAYVSQGYTLAQDYVPEGYAPFRGYTSVQNYASADTQTRYSDNDDSIASPYGTPQTQEMNAYTVDNDDVPEEEEVRNFTLVRRQKCKAKNQALPKEEQPKSKRAERRERIANEHQGEVSATDQPKGLVELREGVFRWWDPEDKEWLKAAYHDWFRDQFIREDSAEGTYVVAPDRGKGTNDITSACSAYNQLAWRLKDRDSWDNIVDADGNKVLYLLERPETQSYYDAERLWIHDGCVLLDGDNNPVRPWPGVPRCFSSKVEGARMEALRRILPMTIQDFRARMLRFVPIGAGIDAETKPLSFPSTFGHRCCRFRTQYQTPAWMARAASAALKKHVTDQLPEAEDATTTEGLQVLSSYETERRKSSNRGKHLYKANGRAISEDERRYRDQKVVEKLDRQAPSQPQTPQRPQSMPTTPFQPASPSIYLPTPPLSAGNKRRRMDDNVGEYNVGKSEPAAKRSRLRTSRFDPRLQGHSSAVQTIIEDRFQQAPNPAPTATGLGLTFGGQSSVLPQHLLPGQNSRVPDPSSQQPEAMSIPATASVYNSQNDNYQLDYRFVDPQNPLEQLRIQAALFYPRAHYHALVGEHPPHTSKGTYSEQYLQIAELLAQKWMVEGGLPTLADIGPWNGSFDMVPVPNLPHGMLELLLNPTTRTPNAPERSITGHDARGLLAGFGGMDVPTVPNSSVALEDDVKPNDWDDDLFGEYLDGYEDADGEEE